MTGRELMACGAALVLVAGCRPAVDVAGESQKLLETDRAWAAAVGGGATVDSVASYWTDDAILAPAGQPTAQGKAAIKVMVTGMMAMPGFHITWTPEKAIVSPGGDMGYTYGTNQITMADAKGKPVVEKGRYLTVWRKEADGRWRCVMDYGNTGPAEAAVKS